MKPLTLFTFGYYGWGNSTPQLVKSVDAVERSRGFKPPIFVDIRIRRTGRAPGFKSTAFERLLGENRHRWMSKLGNRQIVTHTGPRVQIADPSAVNELLDLAIMASEDRRRIIFFCGCEWPRRGGKIACHRTVVASLALEAAKRRGLKAEIVEWPGGKPVRRNVAIDTRDFNALRRSKWNIPVSSLSLGDCAGISWGSIATVNSGDEQIQAVIGPAQFRFDQWQFPVLLKANGYSLAQIGQESAKIRKAYGFEPFSLATK